MRRQASDFVRAGGGVWVFIITATCEFPVLRPAQRVNATSGNRIRATARKSCCDRGPGVQGWMRPLESSFATEGGEGASAWGDAGVLREVPFVAFSQLGKFLEGAAIDGLRGQGAELGEGLRDRRSPVDGTRHIEKDRKRAGREGRGFGTVVPRGEIAARDKGG